MAVYKCIQIKISLCKLKMRQKKETQQWGSLELVSMLNPTLKASLHGNQIFSSRLSGRQQEKQTCVLHHPLSKYRPWLIAGTSAPRAWVRRKFLYIFCVMHTVAVGRSWWPPAVMSPGPYLTSCALAHKGEDAFQCLAWATP